MILHLSLLSLFLFMSAYSFSLLRPFASRFHLTFNELGFSLSFVTPAVLINMSFVSSSIINWNFELDKLTIDSTWESVTVTSLRVGSDSLSCWHSLNEVVQLATNLLNCTVIHIIPVHRMLNSLLKLRYIFVCDIPVISMTCKCVKKGNVTGLVKDWFEEPILVPSHQFSQVLK